MESVECYWRISTAMPICMLAMFDVNKMIGSGIRGDESRAAFEVFHPSMLKIPALVMRRQAGL